jgi:hypothetical protein
MQRIPLAVRSGPHCVMELFLESHSPLVLREEQRENMVRSLCLREPCGRFGTLLFAFKEMLALQTSIAKANAWQRRSLRLSLPTVHLISMRHTYRCSTRTEHILEIALHGVGHNNKMERMNGEIRDRERVMRTFEKPETAILTGMQLYHNYIRPHEALKDKTPAEVAGILVRGQDKWLTLIQNAGKPKH